MAGPADYVQTGIFGRRHQGGLARAIAPVVLAVEDQDRAGVGAQPGTEVLAGQRPETLPRGSEVGAGLDLRLGQRRRKRLPERPFLHPCEPALTVDLQQEGIATCKEPEHAAVIDATPRQDQARSLLWTAMG